jgi:hypothetical protein
MTPSGRLIAGEMLWKQLQAFPILSMTALPVMASQLPTLG